MTERSSADKKTLDVYNSQAKRYRKIVSATKDENLQLFISSVNSGAKILDFGCGVGDAAAIMHAAGLDVDAADASEGMLALAAEHDGLNLLKMEFLELDADDYYDAIWANFSLLHAQKLEMPHILTAIAKALKPQGLFFIALKMGEGEARDKIGRRYAYYSQEECTRLLQDAALIPYQVRFGTGTGLDGSVSNWMGFFCRNVPRKIHHSA